MATAISRIPPGPKGRLLVGSLLDYARDPLGFLLRCAREYGDVVRIRFLNIPVYALNHPDDIKHVLVRQHRNFIKAREYREGLHSFLGNGLLISEGEFWRRQRRLAQPAFHRKQIDTYGATMVANAERMLAQWRDRETRDVHQDMMRLTLEIVAETLFGTTVADVAPEIGAALDVIMAHHVEQDQSFVRRIIPERVPTPSNIRFKRAVQRLDTIIYGIIAKRRASGEDTGDLLSMLLQAQDEDGSRMSDKQLRDEALTPFLAGHETTALALSWTWYLLSLHPDVEAMLHAELREVLDGRAPTVADLPRLRYTTQVIKESMRLYPPAWGIGREAVADCEIGGYHIPAGAQVYMMQYVTHRDPRFFDDPEAFRPERWTDEFEQQLPRFAYFPFGGGPRICIGNTFAMMEAVLLVATSAQRWRFALVPRQTIALLPSITLRPKHGIKMMVSKRETTSQYTNSDNGDPGNDR